MPRINWNITGARFYETGLDRGVLYVNGQPGVAWTGLTSVSERPTGGAKKTFYIDGIKYLIIPSTGDFEATIRAYTYPTEFGVCDGSTRIHSGLFVTQQARKPFGLSYRTIVGNDLDDEFGYKIHLIYNAYASASNREYRTFGDSADPADFSWDIATKPPLMSGYKPTAHLEIDTRYSNPAAVSAIEDILYGTDSDMPRLPTLDELINVFETNAILTVIDNGDGSFTVIGPDTMIQMVDSTTFWITSDSAIYIDDISYTISTL